MGYFSSIYSADLPSRAKTVYFCLRDHADENNQCYPSIATIARETSLSHSTVKRAIADLEHAGFLTKEQRWRENGGKSSLSFTIKT